FGKAGRVRQFQIDPTNPHRIFAVTQNGGGIWYFDTAKGSWVNIPGNLANDPLNRLTSLSLFVDWRFAIPALYVGTDRGVYQSVDCGTTWTHFGAFLPNTQAEDLQGLPDKNILAAGTYGRGAWEISIAPSSVTGRVILNLDGNSTQ